MLKVLSFIAEEDSPGANHNVGVRRELDYWAENYVGAHGLGEWVEETSGRNGDYVHHRKENNSVGFTPNARDCTGTSGSETTESELTNLDDESGSDVSDPEESGSDLKDVDEPGNRIDAASESRGGRGEAVDDAGKHARGMTSSISGFRLKDLNTDPSFELKYQVGQIRIPRTPSNAIAASYTTHPLPTFV